MDLAIALTELTTTAREGKTGPGRSRRRHHHHHQHRRLRNRCGHTDPQPRGGGDPRPRRDPEEPWEYQGEMALRQVMTLSLSFDHRLVDGEQGSRFLPGHRRDAARPGHGTGHGLGGSESTAAGRSLPGERPAAAFRGGETTARWRRGCAEVLSPAARAGAISAASAMLSSSGRARLTRDPAPVAAHRVRRGVDQAEGGVGAHPQLGGLGAGVQPGQDLDPELHVVALERADLGLVVLGQVAEVLVLDPDDVGIAQGKVDMERHEAGEGRQRRRRSRPPPGGRRRAGPG